MQLEIKHLGPYYPHGLKMTRNGFIGELLSIIKYTEKDLSEGYGFKVSCSDWIESLEDRNCYKPLLLPLEKLQEDEWKIAIYACCERDIESDFLDYLYRIEGVRNLIKFAPSTLMQFLFENHFDVFGLIPAGLAIDKTTIIKK